jgi:succinoglycan biosynthesis transport protein ExoP
VAQEGKTTAAANLAVSVARRGTDVLLADFDFRKPALSELFEVPGRAKGALQIMAGTESLDTTLWSVSLEGAYPRVSKNGSAPEEVLSEGVGSDEQLTGALYLLPSGGETSTRTVPQRSRLAPLLRELQAQADLVILDTPPALLTVEVAELSQLIDMILVVVRQGHVSQRNLRTLRRQVRTWPAEFAGAVVTDVPHAGERSYYGSS